jgi:hypothetical protein
MNTYVDTIKFTVKSKEQKILGEVKTQINLNLDCTLELTL